MASVETIQEHLKRQQRRTTGVAIGGIVVAEAAVAVLRVYEHAARGPLRMWAWLGVAAVAVIVYLASLPRFHCPKCGKSVRPWGQVLIKNNTSQDRCPYCRTSFDVPMP